jgi:hypothetical protein
MITTSRRGCVGDRRYAQQGKWSASGSSTGVVQQFDGKIADCVAFAASAGSLAATTRGNPEQRVCRNLVVIHYIIGSNSER